MRTRPTLLLLTLLVVALLACERPLTDPDAPAVELVEPDDLSEVRAEPLLPLAVRASSFSSVDRVMLNGDPMTYDAEAKLWRDTLHLWQNVMPFYVEAVSESRTRRDSFHVAYVPSAPARPGPSLPEPRGGHTTTLLDDGRLLVAGGAPSTGRPASGAVFTSTGTQAFAALDARLLAARTGHTATLLPDGRVLFLGGSRTDVLEDGSSLVATAELFDPSTNTFIEVPVQGEPLQRTLHSALLHTRRGQLYVDVFGGLGVAPFSSEPRLTNRDDLRSFTLRNDSLIDLDGRVGPALLFEEDGSQPLAPYGHTQTPLRPHQPDSGPSLIAGALSGSDDKVQPVGFVVDLSQSPITTEQVRTPFVAPRRRHASVLLGVDMVLHLGGRQPGADALPSELYSRRAKEAFSFPSSRYRDIFVERYAHTATKWSTTRILIVGGFSLAGNGIATSRLIDVSITP